MGGIFTAPIVNFTLLSYYIIDCYCKPFVDQISEVGDVSFILTNKFHNVFQCFGYGLSVRFIHLTMLSFLHVQPSSFCWCQATSSDNVKFVSMESEQFVQLSQAWEIFNPDAYWPFKQYSPTFPVSFVCVSFSC